MIEFNDLSVETFLTEYWQKKPLLIRNGLPHFKTLISEQELAGLSLEEEVESRLVIQKSPTDYQLFTGPFKEDHYQNLPEKDWTLLIQGVDKLIPEIAELLNEFNFIPQWRVDDIMISYATQGGNVGPHYDHYDVFLLQAQGQRQWQLTAQGCTPDNAIEGVDLRLMKHFPVEDTYLCEPGDILYIPPKWGHHGIGLTDDCITYSFGYRSYKGLELWDSFGDYLAEQEAFTDLYLDPNWTQTQPGEISEAAWRQAQTLLQSITTQDALFQQWFGRFATQLDATANQNLPAPLSEEEQLPLLEVIEYATQYGIIKEPLARFAYLNMPVNNQEQAVLYLNSQMVSTHVNSNDFVKALCNQPNISADALKDYFKISENQTLFYQLWVQQMLIIPDEYDS